MFESDKMFESIGMAFMPFLFYNGLKPIPIDLKGILFLRAEAQFQYCPLLCLQINNLYGIWEIKKPNNFVLLGLLYYTANCCSISGISS